ncbi:Rieske 2Fe-2S domain-containing protein [Paenibacillus tyrfis]|uniref:Rieske 2Fe-2S domain-containing protein n=1 Tax=Paenibacillus tyrfis TaxID=1501230 RepID=UPI00209F9BF7|nr:Rieske 2Fe-2S domain-containing protein [Paenibacillus tyrfis]MCP1311615.1 Rieske 2Fe-2S domain-containing protein [Paenibacillus tyrfis]
MLSKEENKLMTHVEGDAPMGKFLRQYWVPACRSEALAADGDPVRVRLFGENFVAFRATDGRVGVFDESCPHRGCSLLLARNEESSLTCIFHGWKFHVSGKTIHVPTEPAERHDAFCKKVPLKSYPVREAGTIIWVYLGDGEAPAFPMFEFNQLPDSHVFSRVGYTTCNYVQGLEATIDTVHAGVLHKDWILNDDSLVDSLSKDEWVSMMENPSAVYEIDHVSYGLKAAALRNLPSGNQYVRVTEYIFPFFTYIPFGNFPKLMIAAVPVDNENTAQWYISYNPNAPVDPTFFDSTIGPDPNNFYNPKGTFDNRWLQDRKKMREGAWTGVGGLIFEDFIVEESMGAIVDRSKEFLGSGDALIARTRRLLLKALRDYEQEKDIFGRNEPIDYASIRAKAGFLPGDIDWRTGAKLQLT